MPSTKITGRYLKAARDILARQPWARGNWFATEKDDYGDYRRSYRAMNEETGYMTVDGKTIPFTKSTAVCAMGAVEAALIQDKNLRPSLRLELYKAIEDILNEATAKVTRDDQELSEYVIEQIQNDYKFYLEDTKRYLPDREPISFEQYLEDAKWDYIYDDGYTSVITYNDEGADSKDDVLGVFDTALADLRPSGPASLALSA